MEKDIKFILNLLNYDLFSRWKLLNDEFNFVRKLTNFYREDSTDSKEYLKLEEEFNLLYSSALKNMEKNLSRINKKINDLKRYSSELTNSQKISNDFLPFWVLYFQNFFETTTGIRRCLNTFNFLQRKLTSLVNAYPTYFTEPKLPSFREVHRAYIYIHRLLDEFGKYIEENVRKDSYILKTIPKDYIFYWAFNNEIETEIIGVDNPPKQEKILKISSDFFTQYQYSQWMVFYHEILHSALGSCLKNAKENPECLVLNNYLSTMIMNIYKIFNYSNFPLNELLNPTPLLLDILIDFLLSSSFGIFYFIPVFVKLFMYDQNMDSYELSDLDSNYPSWYLRLSSVINMLDQNGSMEYLDLFKHIIQKFKEIHINFFLGTKGRIFYQLMDTIHEYITSSWISVLNDKNFYKIIKPFTDFGNYCKENDHAKCQNFFAYKNFLDTYHKISNNLLKMENSGNKQDILFEYELLNILENSLLIYYLSRADYKGNGSQIKSVEILKVLTYKHRFDKKGKMYPGNLKDHLTNFVINCEDFININIKHLYTNLYDLNISYLSNNSNALKNFLYDINENYMLKNFSWENFFVILAKDFDLDSANFDEFISNKILIFSKLSFEQKCQLSSFQENLKRIENKIKQKYYGVIKNVNYIILGSLDWYSFDLLILLEPKKQINYECLSRLLYNIYSQMNCGVTLKNPVVYSESGIFIGNSVSDKISIESPEILIRFSKGANSYWDIKRVKSYLNKFGKTKIYLGKSDLKLTLYGQHNCDKIRNIIYDIIDITDHVLDIKIIP